MNYKFEFTKEELDVVVSALGELPLKVVSNLFDKIKKQYSEQIQSEQVPVEPEVASE